MNYTAQRSRDKFTSAPQLLAKLYPEAKDHIDAEFLSADRKTVLGISGLPFKAPICNFIMGEKEVLDYIDSFEGSIHIAYGDAITANGESVPENIAEIIEDAIA